MAISFLSNKKVVQVAEKVQPRAFCKRAQGDDGDGRRTEQVCYNAFGAARIITFKKRGGKTALSIDKQAKLWYNYKAYEGVADALRSKSTSWLCLACFKLRDSRFCVLSIYFWSTVLPCFFLS